MRPKVPAVHWGAREGSEGMALAVQTDTLPILLFFLSNPLRDTASFSPSGGLKAVHLRGWATPIKSQQLVLENLLVHQESYQVRVTHPSGPGWSNGNYWNDTHINCATQTRKKLQRRKATGQKCTNPTEPPEIPMLLLGAPEDWPNKFTV